MTASTRTTAGRLARLAPLLLVAAAPQTVVAAQDCKVSGGSVLAVAFN